MHARSPISMAQNRRDEDSGDALRLLAEWVGRWSRHLGVICHFLLKVKQVPVKFKPCSEG